MMDDLEKVLNGLECCVISDEESECPAACPYYDECWGVISDKECECPEDCFYYDECRGSVPINGLALKKDALALLKAQQPRVLALEDLRNIGSVWELSTPPYLCMDINPSYRRIMGSWVAWRNIYELINGLHPSYNADNYGKTWRCWTSRPTDEQRKAVKWDD